MGSNLNNICLRTAGSSIQGRSHIAHGKPCEDAWAASSAALSDKCRAVVVCDGAGSKPKGKIGAEITSSLMSTWLVEHVDSLFCCQDSLEELKQQIVSTIQDAINNHIAEEKSDDSIMDYCCTFLGVVIDKNNGWFACHIGDGGIVAKNTAETFIVSGPCKGEYANVTYFITESDANEHLNIYCNTKPAYSFALFSDGLERSLIQTQTNTIAPAVGRILDWLQDNSENAVTHAIENSLKSVFSQSTTDDCTLAILSLAKRKRKRLKKQHPRIKKIKDK